jgi:1-acyl-sn-glycerol-3-phosphate acyltransferase
MNPVRRVLGHVYYFYLLLLFAATMLVVFIPIWITSLLPEPRRARVLHRIFRGWMGVFMPLAFCPVSRKGAGLFKKGTNYVVVCNHNSLVDVPVTSPWIPGPNKTLAKAEMARVPLFGVIYKAGSILVDRKKDSSRRDSFKAMQESLEIGLHLCLYPEGTRNKTAAPMQPFHDGAFIIAIRAQRPIMPAVIFNTGGILPHNRKLWAFPSRVHFHFLEPVPTEGLTNSDVAALKAAVRDRMVQYFITHQQALK